MSRKRHRRQAALQRAQLQKLEAKLASRDSSDNVELADESSPNNIPTKSEVAEQINSSAPVLALDYSWQRELRQTAIAVVAVALLLTGITVAGHRYGYFESFGNQLYSWLRLN